MGTPIANRPLEHVVQQLELSVTTDERGRDAAEAMHAAVGRERAERRNRIAEPAQLERAGRFHLHRAAGQAMCGLADQDLARPRSLLEARGDVDRFARREGRIRLVDDYLARLDADARLELELVHPVEHGHRGPDGALGIVLV